MNLLKKLEDVVSENDIPAWTTGLAGSALATGSALGFLELGYRERLTMPEEAYLALVGGLGFFFVKGYFERSNLIRKFGIRESSEIPEKKLEWPWLPWDAFFLYPKISGPVTATALVVGKTVLDSPGNLFNLTERLDYYSTYFSTKLAQDPDTYLLTLAADLGLRSAFLGFGLYRAIDLLSRVGSSEALKKTKDRYRVVFSRGEERLRRSQEFFEKHPSKLTAFQHATECLMQDEVDTAAFYVKKVNDLPSKPYFSNSSVQESFLMGFGDLYKRWKKKREITIALTLVSMVQEFGEEAKAAEFMDEVAEGANSAEDYALLGWWAYEVMDLPGMSGDLWRESFLRMLDSSGYRKELLGEDLKGVNNVYRIGLPFIKEETILKEQDSGQTEYESGMLRFIEENLLRDDPGYTVPRAVSDFNYDGRSVLVTKYHSGKTLFEKVVERQAGLDDLIRITEFLSRLHSGIPVGMSRTGYVDLKSKMRSVVENPSLGMPEDLQYNTLRNSEFIADQLEDSGRVVSQDAHGGQWIFTPDYLLKVDHNDNGVESLFRDLAKRDVHPLMSSFLFEEDAFHPLQKETYEIYRSAGLTGRSENEFRRSHLQAMLLQALSFASAWSSPQQIYSRNLRSPVMEGAVENVMDAIRQDHTEHYNSHKRNYAELEEVFREQAATLQQK